jgi:GNAT superfamily N-acetyltransferase
VAGNSRYHACRMSARLDLPDGLTHRSPVPDDASGVYELYALCESIVQGEPDVELDDIVADWRRPSFDLAADAVLVLDGDRIVAEGELFMGRRAEVAVHPDARGRGIGTALLGWTQARARELGSSLVGQTTNDEERSAHDLFRANGYEPMWTSWILSYAIGSPPEPPGLPEGYAFRPFVLGTDDREVYDVVERAFSEWPDRDPYPYEDWRVRTVEMPGFDPTAQVVIVRDGRIVATANTADPAQGTEGWVHQLAVEREHRGQGLGRALLQQTFVDFHARGKSSVGLNTDSRTGALGLYEHVGMRVTRSYTHHAKQL